MNLTLILLFYFSVKSLLVRHNNSKMWTKKMSTNCRQKMPLFGARKMPKVKKAKRTKTSKVTSTKKSNKRRFEVDTKRNRCRQNVVNDERSRRKVIWIIEDDYYSITLLCQPRRQHSNFNILNPSHLCLCV